MSNIPYLEQLTNDEVVTASKAANLALQVQRVSNKLPYTSYVVLLKFAGSSFTQTVVYNDILATLTWTIEPTAGIHTLTASSPVFVASKTFVMFNKTCANTLYSSNTVVSDAFVYRSSDTEIKLDTSYMDNTNRINNSSIEIRVYN